MPPVGHGFKAFVHAPAITDAAREHLEHELEQGITDPYDSHPSLKQRSGIDLSRTLQILLKNADLALGKIGVVIVDVGFVVQTKRARIEIR